MSQPSAVPALRVVSCVRWAAPAAKTASVAWMPKWLWEKMVARMRAVGRYDSGRVRERLRGPQGRANQLLLAA